MKIEITENKKWHHSLTIKMVLLGILGIFLLVPLELIKSIIKERQTTSENVKKEIAFQWAGKQTITGPVLNIPVWIYPSGDEGKPYRKIFHLMPEELKIEGDISTEKRHRSIYKTVVYNTELKLYGIFIIPEINSEERGEIQWNESYYTLGISDNRGLKGGVTLLSDSTSLQAIPGLKDSDLFSTGISFNSKISEKIEKIDFSVNIRLSGSESINFSPLW